MFYGSETVDRIGQPADAMHMHFSA